MSTLEVCPRIAEDAVERVPPPIQVRLFRRQPEIASTCWFAQHDQHVEARVIACRPPRLRVGDYVWGDLFSGSVLLVVGTRRRPHVVDLLRCVRVAARTSALDGSTSVMQEPHFSLIAFGPMDYALIHDFGPR